MKNKILNVVGIMAFATAIIAGGLFVTSGCLSTAIAAPSTPPVLNDSALLHRVIDRVKAHPQMTKAQVSLTKAELKVLIYTRVVPKVRDEFKGQLDNCIANGTITQAQEDTILGYYDQVMAQWFTQKLSSLIDKQYKLGWKPDDQSMTYKAAPVKIMAKIPAAATVDTLAAEAIQNQGSIGSCTTFGGLRAYLYALLKQQGAAALFEPSHLGLYYDERSDKANDTGYTISGMIAALQQKGVGHEALWPYDTAKFTVAPAAEYAADALQHQVIKAGKLYGLDSVKNALAQGYPVVVGVYCFKDFLSQETAQTGNIPDPGWFDSVQGGHCICIVAYDDATGRLTFANSWGPEWGKLGFGTISYKYLQKYGSDFWIIYSVEIPEVQAKKTSHIDYRAIPHAGWRVIDTLANEQKVA